MSIRKRLFLVGCPRSGTTLLQSLVAAHPDVVSFPESHFFARLRSRRWWVNQVGLASCKAQSHMERYFRDLCVWNTYRSHASTAMLNPGTLCKTFVNTLDDLAEEEQAQYWLEKTPRHIHYLSDIEEFVPRTHIIHLLRRGEDTVASLYHAKNTYPEEWGGPISIEECCKRWERDIEISLDYHGKPGHTLVTYKELATSTEAVLRKIVDRAGFRYKTSMIRNYGQASEDVIRNDEEWKEGTKRKIEPSRSEKFRSVFNSKERTEVANHVNELNEIIRKL